MRRTVIAFGLVLSLVVLLGAGPDSVLAKGKGEPWTGEWRTSFSTLQLKQDGKTVTGTYGNQGQFSIEGKVMGDICAFTYDEGNVTGKGEWVMQEGNCCFKGKLIMANGRPRDWNGWRPDPAAREGQGQVQGHVDDLAQGLMQLEQKGKQGQGHVRLARELDDQRVRLRAGGWTSTFQIFRGGDGWFDMAKDGKTFAGAGARRMAPMGLVGVEGPGSAPEYVTPRQARGRQDRRRRDGRRC